MMKRIVAAVVKSIVRVMLKIVGMKRVVLKEVTLRIIE